MDMAHIVDVPFYVAPPSPHLRKGLCGSNASNFYKIDTVRNDPKHWLTHKYMCESCALLFFEMESK